MDNRRAESNSRPALRLGAAVGLLAIAAATLWQFWLSRRYYGGYRIPASGTEALPATELAFDAMYLAYGIPFVLALGWAARLARLDGLLNHRRFALHRVRGLPYLLAAVAFVGAWVSRLWVLRGQAVTDDEEVYLFIARTLLKGRLTNPPPIDPDFLANQFIIASSGGWFGKYPVGHGVVLAVGLVTHTLPVLGPAMAALCVVITWRLARDLVGPRRAAMAALLLALSPHFVGTYATLLSQTTSCLALMLGLIAVQRWRRTGKWTAVAWGMGALAFGVLARPMPGVLFIPVAALVIVTARRPRREVWAALIAVAVIGAAAALLVAGVNWAQNGSAVKSGYQVVHHDLGVLGGGPGASGQSVFANLLRENFWLFGWPLSLGLIAFARVKRGRWLLWGPVVAELVYRVFFPKTVVSTTGPTYLMEMVPLLAILSSDGLARLRAWGARGERGSWLLPALVLTSVCFFLPIQILNARRGADARSVVFDRLEEVGAPPALVFSNLLVKPEALTTWAYYPPNPSPDLDDPIVFLRWPHGAGAAARAIRLIRTRFSDRPAFVFFVSPTPQLLPLDQALDSLGEDELSRRMTSE